MMKRYYSWVAVMGLLAFSIAFFAVVRSGSAKVPSPQQFPIMDQVANKVIAKYQNSTCAQLWIKKTEKAPPTAEEVKAITFLKRDPQMRPSCITIIAAPSS